MAAVQQKYVSKKIKGEQLTLAARELKAELYGRSMHDYIQGVSWPVVEPKTKFIDNWHIHAICEHLEAVLNGEIQNLLINMPPRFMKSLIVAVSFPTYAWVTNAEKRFIFASYAGALSTRDSVKARRVIDSPMYQQLWGDKFSMTSDQNVKNRYENDKTGYRISTSVGGLGTGEGGDIIVVDDPHNVLEGESIAKLGEAIEWWDETMSTRLNDPDTGSKIIVMQRVSAGDLSGHILRKGGYEHLMIPMRFEEKRVCITVKGRIDPRVEDGELAWPDRFSETAVQKLERAMGSHAVAGQFQQRPASREGAIFKRVWFPRYRMGTLQKPDMKVLVIDTATKDAQRNDWTAAGLFYVYSGERRAYLVKVRRERLDYPALKKKLVLWRIADQPHLIRVEDKGNGSALLQECRAEGGWPIQGYEPGDTQKEIRAEQEAAIAESGALSLPEENPDIEWLQDYEDELFEFPAGLFDDQVDFTVNFLNWFRTSIFTPFGGFVGFGTSTASDEMRGRMLGGIT